MHSQELKVFHTWGNEKSYYVMPSSPKNNFQLRRHIQCVSLSSLSSLTSHTPLTHGERALFSLYSLCKSTYCYMRKHTHTNTQLSHTHKFVLHNFRNTFVAPSCLGQFLIHSGSSYSHNMFFVKKLRRDIQLEPRFMGSKLKEQVK